MASEDVDLVRARMQEEQQRREAGHPIPQTRYKAVVIQSAPGYFNHPDLDQREMLADGWVVDKVWVESAGTVVLWSRFDPVVYMDVDQER